MRGKQSRKRKIKEESVYKSLVASKFINKLMKSGKKMLAEKIFYKSMDILKKDLKRKRTMNIILFIFIVVATAFLSSSTNNLIAVNNAGLLNSARK
jgi:hypothetical protein